jgi:hypothetical protein
MMFILRCCVCKCLTLNCGFRCNILFPHLVWRQVRTDRVRSRHQRRWLRRFAGGGSASRRKKRSKQKHMCTHMCTYVHVRAHMCT